MVSSYAIEFKIIIRETGQLKRSFTVSNLGGQFIVDVFKFKLFRPKVVVMATSQANRR